MIYRWHSLSQIKQIIEALTAPMPYELQSVAAKIRPQNLEISHYREDLITVTYCKYNNQKFFVRAYYLRQNGGNFFKVEVTMHSDTLPDTKYFDWYKAYRGAFNFFQLIDQEAEAICPLDLHLDDYFFPETFEKEVCALQKALSAVKECNNSTVRKALIEKFKDQAMTFQLEAKSMAATYISSLKKQSSIGDTLVNWR